MKVAVQLHCPVVAADNIVRCCCHYDCFGQVSLKSADTFASEPLVCRVSEENLGCGVCCAVDSGIPRFTIKNQPLSVLVLLAGDATQAAACYQKLHPYSRTLNRDG
jgi:hypothetical protein